MPSAIPGHYEYELPPTFRSVQEMTIGSVTWTYDGQQPFPYDRTHVEDLVWVRDGDGVAALTHEERMSATHLVDALGRRWAYGWTDEAALAEVEERAEVLEREAHPSFDSVDTAATDPNVIELEDEDGEPYLAKLDGWTHANCDADPTNEHNIFDGESRSINNYAERVHKTTVLIYLAVDTNGNGVPDGLASCTGNLLDGDGDIVTTAAHCVTANDNFNAVADPNDVRVCSFGNEAGRTPSQCRTVSFISANTPYYTWPHDVNEDFAIIGLSSAFPSLGHFQVSAATSTTWDTETIHEEAYPGFEIGDPPGCTPNATGTQAMSSFTDSASQTVSVSGMRQVGQSHLNDDFYTTNQIRTRFDTAGGHSGASMYYCPSDCSTGAFIIGIHSVWDPALDRVKGPQAHLFRSFFNSFL